MVCWEHPVFDYVEFLNEVNRFGGTQGPLDSGDPCVALSECFSTIALDTVIAVMVYWLQIAIMTLIGWYQDSLYMYHVRSRNATCLQVVNLCHQSQSRLSCSSRDHVCQKTKFKVRRVTWCNTTGPEYVTREASEPEPDLIFDGFNTVYIRPYSMRHQNSCTATMYFIV